MSKQSLIRVFFDASCLVAAAGSPQGGAGYVLSNCVDTPIAAVTNVYAWAEAERNVRLKLRPLAFERLEVLKDVGVFDFVFEDDVGDDVGDEPAEFGSVNVKDQPIVRGALAGHCNYLLTLDRPLIQEVRQSNLELSALLPENFIIEVMRPLLALGNE